MTNDQYTEWLEHAADNCVAISKLIPDEADAMKHAGIAIGLRKALKQYREQSSWIPVTPETMPEVTQLLEAVRAYQHTVTIMESFKSEDEYWFDVWQAAVSIAGKRLSSALKPFEK